MSDEEIVVERPLVDLAALMDERKLQDKDRIRWDLTREGPEGEAEPFIEGRGGVVYPFSEDLVAVAVSPIEKAGGGERRPSLLDALEFDPRFEKVEASGAAGAFSTSVENLDLACFLIRAKPENRSDRKYRRMIERLAKGLDPDGPDEEEDENGAEAAARTTEEAIQEEAEGKEEEGEKSETTGGAPADPPADPDETPHSPSTAEKEGGE